ncbi:MAG: hypothetical protein U0228_13080 [Myxococcaceae bacterium]
MRWAWCVAALTLASCTKPVEKPPPGDAPLANCLAAPELVDFGQLVVGGINTRTFSLTNVSISPVKLALGTLPTPFRARLVRDVSLLAPGEVLEVAIDVGTADDQLHEAVLEIATTCLAAEPPTGTLRVPVRATTAGVDAAPNPIDFGYVPPGTSATRTVRIGNPDDTLLTERLSLEDPEGVFRIENAVQIISVPPHGTTTVQLIATPREVRPYAGSLVLPGVGVPVTVNGGTPPILRITPIHSDVVADFTPDAGSWIERMIEVRNDALPPLGADLIIEGHVASNDGFYQIEQELEVRLPDTRHIPAGAGAKLVFRFIPPGVGTRHYEWIPNFTDTLRATFDVSASPLPPCTMQAPTELLLSPGPSSGTYGVVSFTNTGQADCYLDDVRTELNGDRGFTVLDGGTPQVVLRAGQSHQVVLSGPDAGADRAVYLGYHVLGPGSVRQRVLVRAP